MSDNSDKSSKGINNPYNGLTFAEYFGQIFENEKTGFNIFEKEKSPKGVKELFLGTIEELVTTDLYWENTCTFPKSFYKEETNNSIAKSFVGWLANLYTYPEKKAYLQTIKPETVVVCF
jgi:hypothetical protein